MAEKIAMISPDTKAKPSKESKQAAGKSDSNKSAAKAEKKSRIQIDVDKKQLKKDAEAYYPYKTKIARTEYEAIKYELQIELLKMQNWVKETGQKVVIMFEGRDAAGKGGTIKRFMEHLNPRGAHVIALEKPTEYEQGQWYYQRYLKHLPSAGEIVLFDRSWYNRAGVEKVMGFCSSS
ncbi:MAG: polyphosphate kinase 2, partial [Sedimenticola sp.]